MVGEEFTGFKIKKKTLSQGLDQAEDLKSEMIEQKSVFYRPTILSLSDSLAL